MDELDTIKQAVDNLNPDEFAQLYQYIHQHPRSNSTWGAVPGGNLHRIAEVLRPVQQEADTMSESEIDHVIDQAISGARRERKAKDRD